MPGRPHGTSPVDQTVAVLMSGPPATRDVCRGRVGDQSVHVLARPLSGRPLAARDAAECGGALAWIMRGCSRAACPWTESRDSSAGRSASNIASRTAAVRTQRRSPQPDGPTDTPATVVRTDTNTHPPSPVRSEFRRLCGGGGGNSLTLRRRRGRRRWWRRRGRIDLFSRTGATRTPGGPSRCLRTPAPQGAPLRPPSCAAFRSLPAEATTTSTGQLQLEIFEGRVRSVAGMPRSVLRAAERARRPRRARRVRGGK